MTTIEEAFISSISGINLIPTNIRLMASTLNTFNVEHVVKYPSLANYSGIYKDNKILQLHKQVRHILDKDYENVESIEHILDYIIGSNYINIRELYNARPDLFQNITYNSYPHLLPIMHNIKHDFISKDNIMKILRKIDREKYALILYKNGYNVITSKYFLRYPEDFIEYIIDNEVSKLDRLVKKIAFIEYKNNEKIMRFFYKNSYINDIYVLEHKILTLYESLRYPALISYDMAKKLHYNTKHYVSMDEDNMHKVMDYKNVYISIEYLPSLVYIMLTHKGNKLLDPNTLDLDFIENRFFDNSAIYRRIIQESMINSDKLSCLIKRFLVDKRITLNRMSFSDITIVQRNV